MDRSKLWSWKAYSAGRHGACGTKPDDWIDEDGRMRNPPRFEVILDTCPGCEEIGRVQAEFAARLPKEPLEAQRASAGVLFRVVPFDPRRELPDMLEFVGPSLSATEPSLADPVMRDGRVLTPDG